MGLPGVYETVPSGHQESRPVGKIRRNEGPEVPGDDSTRQGPITRNEGVLLRLWRVVRPFVFQFATKRFPSGSRTKAISEPPSRTLYGGLSGSMPFAARADSASSMLSTVTAMWPYPVPSS